MSLPAPNLDDRKYQDIVDEAKRLIPRYCPEWTNHNVSDPGVALIEELQRLVDDRQGLQAEEVELHQTRALHPLHIELGGRQL